MAKRSCPKCGAPVLFAEPICHELYDVFECQNPHKCHTFFTDEQGRLEEINEGEASKNH